MVNRKARFQAVLVDIAGVLQVGGQVLAGVVPALQALREGGVSLRFVTNTTRTPTAALLDTLQAIGLDVRAHELVTAIGLTGRYVREQGLAPHFLVHPDIEHELGCSASTPDAVVLGDAGPHFSYQRLNEVFRLLMQGLPLIVMARNRYFREPDGLSLDLGAFVAALEYAAQVQASVTGKPSAFCFASVLDDLGVPAERVLMIGDDVRDDILGAQSAGMRGMLVRTGKYRRGDENLLAPGCVMDDFAAVVRAVLDGELGPGEGA